MFNSFVESAGSNLTIVFLCEHGAAKSILAAAYFNHLADELGIKMRSVARGTNPDPILSPQTIAGLTRDGLTPTESFPRELTEADMKSASRVITFCELPEKYPQTIPIEFWKDVPPVSEDYARSRDIIIDRIRLLLKKME